MGANEFPSPIGVLYISIGKCQSIISFQFVSVPYWGSLYFNKRGNNYENI